jgi:hypothetical protein
VVTVYRAPKFTNDISQLEIRKMDCMDCHNRPSHRYVPPDQAVNLAMELGQIDRTIPWIKTNAVYVLTRKYNTDIQARDGIATALAGTLSQRPAHPAGHPGGAADLPGQFLSRNEGQLERLSGQPRPHALARLFPLPRRQSQDRRGQNHQGQRLQRLPHHPRAGQRRGVAANDPGRPAFQTRWWRL